MIAPIKANWAAPKHVHAYTTTRQGGISQDSYKSLNLASHVADDAYNVFYNRHLLMQKLHLPSTPIWLHQTHSNIAVNATDYLPNTPADAAFTTVPNVVCAVLTADCLPLLVCNQEGTEVAAIHAGWRGLAAGIIENTFAKLINKPADYLVWLGPAIGPQAFEVGDEVREIFILQDPATKLCFIPSRTKERWMANLYALATLRLNYLGVTKITGGNFCTYTQNDQFYSYRRDPKAGRIASLIWLT